MNMSIVIGKIRDAHLNYRISGQQYNELMNSKLDADDLYDALVEASEAHESRQPAAFDPDWVK